MADAGASSPLSEANLLALTGEEALEDIRELTLRNHKLQHFDEGDTHRLINLQVMSLSHNLLSSLAGFQHLKQLISLNLNFNALTSLEGLGHCTALQHLFVANNRVRDVSPLLPCTNLQTLHLFRNNIANLDHTVTALGHLPKLRELELAGNPCALAPEYKHRVVLQLDLASFDGDAIGQLDYDLANEFFAANGGMPAGLGPRVDILTIEEVDPAAGGAASATTSGPLGEPVASEPALAPHAAAVPASASGDGSGPGPGAGAATGGTAETVPNHHTHPHQHQAGATIASGRTAGDPHPARPGPGDSVGGGGGTGAGPHSSSDTLSNGRVATAAWGPSSRPAATAPTAAAGAAAGSAAALRSHPAGPGPSTAAAAAAAAAAPPLPLLPRPNTAGWRPGSASGRPGSAYSGLQSSVQLLSNELLNDHPLIIEYLAKHVLMEGLALTGEQPGPGGGWAGRPGSGGSAAGGGGGPGGPGRGPSFAQRLRDTAAAMNACEEMDTKALAEQQQELIATPLTVRRCMAEEMVASASPNELCRQLVRLCEVLIKEVEACRAGRPLSGGAGSGRPGTSSGRPGTSYGLRPMTPGPSTSSATGSTSSSILTPVEVGELIQLRADVERLCRENKALRLENENMYWLMEEVKRLKAEKGEAKER